MHKQYKQLHTQLVVKVLTLPTASGTLVATGDTGSVSNSMLGTGIDAAKLADGSISNTEFQYLNGVSSAIQTQIKQKQVMVMPLLWQ